ncbi:MAG TPA: hypothetical protein DCS93_06505 [Microscillaceae bacterium]|nr:hypothetical protein [Microscillaceae bacterium]
MNWKLIYHLYEGIAVLLISVAWGAMIFGAPLANKADYRSVNILLENLFDQAFKQSQDNLELLCLDVKNQGNSREGKECILRAEALNVRLNKAHQKINKIKNQLVHGNVAGEEYAIEVFKQQVKWIKQEFKYLELPPIADIKYHESNDILGVPHYATKSLLLSYQIKLEEYKAAVLYRLGAGDLSMIRCRFGWSFYIIAHSRVIQVGDEYKADILDDRFSDIYDVKYFANNQILQYSSFGFEAKGKGKKSFNLTILYRNGYDNKLYSIEKNIPYTVISK